MAADANLPNRRDAAATVMGEVLLPRLDSPLVTYKEPDFDADRIPPNVIDHFYRSFLAFPGQAIVVENATPLPDVLEQARIVTFSGSGARPGFFPARPSTANRN